MGVRFSTKSSSSGLNIHFFLPLPTYFTLNFADQVKFSTMERLCRIILVISMATWAGAQECPSKSLLHVNENFKYF